jgi:pre-mRNA-splicing factor RBM22/SLT11
MFLALPTCNEDQVRTSLVFTCPWVKPTDIRSIKVLEAQRESPSFSLARMTVEERKNGGIELMIDCAFVNFNTRALAERTAEGLSAQGGIEIEGKKAKVAWGRSKPGKGKGKAVTEAVAA